MKLPESGGWSGRRVGRLRLDSTVDINTRKRTEGRTGTAVVVTSYIASISYHNSHIPPVTADDIAVVLSTSTHCTYHYSVNLYIVHPSYSATNPQGAPCSSSTSFE